jgi:LemA protein
LYRAARLLPRPSPPLHMHRTPPGGQIGYILFIRQLAMDPTMTQRSSTPSLFTRWAAMLFSAVLASALLSGCGYNQFQAKDEATKAAWSEVVNQYQRRADLIPNLVNTVKGYASHERETLEAVTRARAAATSFQITPEVLNNPEAFQKFQQVQGELSSALSRLMAVSENYPNLKADTQFRDLQSQLEGTENRITVARQRYIATVQDYNVLARSFPTNLTAKMFGYQPKPSFTVENEKSISTAPKVDFGK